MAPVELLGVAIGLALDAAAVSFGAAASGFTRDPRARFRLAFHFGLFQALMPPFGWFLGIQTTDWVATWDHWIAFGLLALVGARMIRSGVETETTFRSDPSRGAMLVVLSVATSIDALVVGLTLALLGVQILLPCLLIGLITAGLSLVGIRLGASLSARFGKRMEILGGFLLLLIGVRILLEHAMP